MTSPLVMLIVSAFVVVCRLVASDVTMSADIRRTTDDVGGRRPELVGHARPDPQVRVAGGRVRLGSDDPQRADNGEYPTRIVDMTSMKIDRYTVTNGDFMMFARDKPRYKTDAERRGYSWVLDSHVTNMADVYDHRVVGHPDGTQWRAVRNATWFQPYGSGSDIKTTTTGRRLRLPIAHVSQRDAFAFCVWAQKRLPTEDEWEHAAKAGRNESIYPWGQTFTASRSNLRQRDQLQSVTNLSNIDSIGLTPVNMFQPQNTLGQYDALGNVWEWTTTVFTAPGRTRDRNRPQYVVKGGSFIDYADDITISSRMGLAQDYSAENIGFRCVEADPDADRRQPVTHLMTETWAYKVKRTVAKIIGPLSKGLRITDEL